jgi:hypothetical protein
MFFRLICILLVLIPASVCRSGPMAVNVRFDRIPDPSTPRRSVVEPVALQKGGKPLADGASETGVSLRADLASRIEQDLDAGFEYFKRQMDDFAREIQKIPESDEYRRLKRSIEELAQEISQAGKKAGKKLKEQWLPRIERELDALKEQLKEQGRDKEVEPLDDETDRILKI